MIIVPRDVYDSLKPKALTEAENSEQFNVIEFLKDKSRVERLQWLKQNTALVGSGSSRIAFILNDMTVLKIASNDRGTAQNRQEYQNTVDENGHGKYSCFSEIYEADTDNWEMLRVEMATPAKESDFKHMLGMGFAGEAILIPVALHVCKGDVKRLLTSDILLKKLIDTLELDDVYENKELLDMLRSERFTEIMYRIVKNRPKPGSETNLDSVYKFFNDNGLKKMMPQDLTFDENWGTVWRNGVNQLIIIDSGFSEDVWNNYYSY